MSMNDIVIRRETADDYRPMEELIREAFWDVYMPGCNEHFLAHILRTSPAFLPEFSFAAEKNSRLAGGIFYAEAAIRRKDGSSLVIPTFGPVAVLPELQKQGIGAALIRHTIPLVRTAGYDGIVIYGSPAYYRRFGFEPGEKYGISDREGKFHDALQILPFHTGTDLSGTFDEGADYHISPEDSAAFDLAFPQKTKHVRPGQLFSDPSANPPDPPEK